FLRGRPPPGGPSRHPLAGGVPFGPRPELPRRRGQPARCRALLRRQGQPRPVKARSAFYVAHAVLMIAIVIWGFFPYFAPLLTQGAVPSRFQHWGIHLRSAVNMGWMFLYTALAVLAWRRRIDLHRRFGPLAAAYGALVAVVGLCAGFVLALRRNEVGT